MPISDLKPGMMATAKTIFQADSIEEFGVEIIDILHNFYPKRDVVVVRLHGEKAEFAGPTFGMSGSPVYYENKLIGALAYSFSPFPKDPIMGVTPIGEMLEIFDREKNREKEHAYAGQFETMDKFVRVAMGFTAHDWQSFLPGEQHVVTQGSMQHLPLSLNISGFSEETFTLANDYFSHWNLLTVRGGSSGNAAPGVELVPGAPVAAVLVSGDYDIAATGTVTYRSGNKILGFGHPFFDNGPIEVPMAQAHILVTLSNSLGSSKLSSTGKITGTLRQDRTTGIMGEIGPLPEMTSVKMSYTSENSDTAQFQFAITKEQTLSSFAPLLLRLALINGLESARLGTGFNTLQVSGYARLDDGTMLSLDNLYPGYQPTASFSFLNGVLHSTGDIAARLAALTNNPYKIAKFSDVKVDFVSISGRKSAMLEEIWLNTTEVEPGDKLEISYSLRPHLAEPFITKQVLTIPKSIKGRRLTIVVGGATAINMYERRLSPGKFKATSYNKLLNILQNNRRNDRLFIQVRLADRGVAMQNDELPGLPPSVYPILTYRNSKDETTPTRDWVVKEIEIPQPFMVTGIQAVALRLK
ncbi:MAG: hypothetical protein ACE5I1_02290 [bacterium]